MSRRRLLVPCIIVWATLAWLVTIGSTGPLDPTPAAWSHAAGRLLLVLVAGSVLVWPATLLGSPMRHTVTVAVECATVAVLLVAAVAGLLLHGGLEPASALAGAALLGTWVLAVGGICAMAGRTRRLWPVPLTGALMVALLPSAVFMPQPWPLLAGPLAATWSIGPDSVATVVWACTLLPLVVLLATWRATCPPTMFQRGSAS